MTEFFDELPPSSWDQFRRRHVEHFADEVTAHPGQWAKYPFPSPSALAARAMATRIRHGRVKAFASGFDAVTRGDVVYVRYSGK